MKEANRTTSVMRAAGLVGVAVLLSRVVGLGREIVTRSLLGVTTLEATAYDIASRFPEAIFLVIAGGAIGSAFIPTFAAYFARDDEDGAWRLFSAVINLLTVAVILIAALTMLLAPQFVRFFFGENLGQEPLLLPLTVRLMRIMLLSPIIFGVSGVFMGALNARQHFLLPALAPTIYNLGIIAGALLLKPTEMGLAWGTVAGALGHLLVQLPGLRQKRARYTAVFTLHDPGVQQVLRLMAPRVLGLSFSEINKFVVLFLTGSMPLGSLPALTTAFRLLIMPQGVLGQALGIAAFPTLAELAARSALREMRQIVMDSLRLVLFLGLPITVLFMLLRQPIITILFERGLFDADDTNLVAVALLFYALGLVALTALEVIARAFYSLNDTLTPVLAGGVQILLMAGLSLWLSQRLFPSLGQQPLGGLALGFSISNFAEVGLLLWLLRRKLGGLNGRFLLNGLLRMGVASLTMGVGMWGMAQLWQLPSLLLQAIVGTIVGIVLYLGASWLLRVEELTKFVGYGRRLWRR
ncbi:MAG: murein biosynthesis integral membrane protein MurJ [Anaerolineales bacterium]|nr:murein biosynthesis integral membrane protein MurJ [Anaerolineales bacterium]